MATTQASAPRRASLSFSVEGLTVRDELLLKSLVRVLDHRSLQHWDCVERGGDLAVSGAPAAPETLDAAAARSRAVLRVGHPGAPGEFSLAMPLHPMHIESTFNRIGEHLLQARAVVAASATAPAAVPALRTDGLYRLRRWPPPELVDCPARLNLAALMSVRPQSQQTLHQRSGVPQAECERFLLDLLDAQLLQCHAASVTPGATAASVPTNGAAQALHAGHAANAANTAHKTPPSGGVQMGLIARIRARFSLLPASVR